MTNEEARKILDSSFVWQKMVDEECQALGMAIKALEQQPCEDLISRQAVEEMIKSELPERGMWEIYGDKVNEAVCEVCIDLMQKLSDLPPVTPQPKTVEGFQWIPIKTRPLTDEERKENPEVLFYYDCPLPDDGEDVLVTTFLGDVRMDCFYRDPEDGCFFETYCDEDDVKAWARIPKPWDGKE